MGSAALTVRHPLYPQKLALTSPTSCGRSVGIVRSRTQATELVMWHRVEANRCFWEMHCLHLQGLKVCRASIPASIKQFRYLLRNVGKWTRIFFTYTAVRTSYPTTVRFVSHRLCYIVLRGVFKCNSHSHLFRFPTQGWWIFCNSSAKLERKNIRNNYLFDLARRVLKNKLSWGIFSWLRNSITWYQKFITVYTLNPTLSQLDPLHSFTHLL
jgi:hypothetical protein